MNVVNVKNNKGIYNLIVSSLKNLKEIQDVVNVKIKMFSN